MTLLIVAIAAFNAIYFSHQQSSLINLAFEERLKKIADIITLGTGVSLRSGKLEVVRATVDRVEEDKDLAFLLIFDEDAVELIRHGDVHKTQMDRAQFFALPEKRMQKVGDYLVRKDRIVFGDEELGFSIFGTAKVE